MSFLDQSQNSTSATTIDNSQIMVFSRRLFCRIGCMDFGAEGFFMGLV
jgi:hypothetical protein